MVFDLWTLAFDLGSEVEAFNKAFWLGMRSKTKTQDQRSKKDQPEV